MRLAHNALALLTQPHVAARYAQFLCSRAVHRGGAVRRLPGGIRIGGFSGFSEFLNCAAYANAAERRFLRRFPFGDGVIVDVGANLGIVSLMLAKRFSECEVHAFEPNPATFQALSANVSRNGSANIQAHDAAVAAHDGEIDFQTDPIHRATTHVIPDGRPNVGVNAAAPVTRVRCVTLDRFAAARAIREIELLKVDVEGYEPLVFQGARELLGSRRVRMIYYEVCPEMARQAGFAPEDASRHLQEHGYRLHRLDKNGQLQDADLSLIGQTVLANWVAVRA